MLHFWLIYTPIDNFLNDNLEESEADASEGPAFPEDRLTAVDTSELESHTDDFIRTSMREWRYEGSRILQHPLIPTVHDPDIWVIRVKVFFFFGS